MQFWLSKMNMLSTFLEGKVRSRLYNCLTSKSQIRLAFRFLAKYISIQAENELRPCMDLKKLVRKKLAL